MAVAVEHRELIENLIANLPPDHKDLRFLRGQLELTRAYIENTRENLIRKKGPGRPRASEEVVIGNGTRLRELRVEKKLSQRTLGEQAGVSGGRISLLETGYASRVKRPCLEKLAAFLGVDLEELLSRS